MEVVRNPENVVHPLHGDDGDRRGSGATREGGGNRARRGGDPRALRSAGGGADQLGAIGEADAVTDRDHHTVTSARTASTSMPQWSPVLSTGITSPHHRRLDVARGAAMEPGLIDRDHRPLPGHLVNGLRAAMEPGLTDRDHLRSMHRDSSPSTRRNGARSYRPGSPRAQAPRPHAPRSRNGARSYRPGSLVWPTSQRVRPS